MTEWPYNPAELGEVIDRETFHAIAAPVHGPELHDGRVSTDDATPPSVLRLLGIKPCPARDCHEGTVCDGQDEWGNYLTRDCKLCAGGTLIVGQVQP